MREKELKELIRHELSSGKTDVTKIEGRGALNFLNIDDVPVIGEGVPIHQSSIIPIECENDSVKFPEFIKDINDPFIKLIQSSDKSWIIFTDNSNEPKLVMDADKFLRHALLSPETTDPAQFSHKPVVFHDAKTTIGEAMSMLKFDRNLKHDDILKHDVILVWTQEKIIVTGNDFLGALLRGIAV